MVRMLYKSQTGSQGKTKYYREGWETERLQRVLLQGLPIFTLEIKTNTDQFNQTSRFSWASEFYSFCYFPGMNLLGDYTVSLRMGKKC